MAHPRILLADPDRRLLTAYQEYLTADGYNVFTSRTAAGCVERISDCIPDVLVVDLDLTREWGEQLLGLKWADGEAWIPVIILTSQPDENGQARVAPFPVTAWHVKPLGPAVLANRIRKLLDSPACPDVFVTEWAQPNEVESRAEPEPVSAADFR
jgi:DNA-binding response OmpR family regulator